jgi:phage-related protein
MKQSTTLKLAVVVAALLVVICTAHNVAAERTTLEAADDIQAQALHQRTVEQRTRFFGSIFNKIKSSASSMLGSAKSTFGGFANKAKSLVSQGMGMAKGFAAKAKGMFGNFMGQAKGLAGGFVNKIGGILGRHPLPGAAGAMAGGVNPIQQLLAGAGGNPVALAQKIASQFGAQAQTIVQQIAPQLEQIHAGFSQQVKAALGGAAQ